MLYGSIKKARLLRKPLRLGWAQRGERRFGARKKTGAQKTSEDPENRSPRQLMQLNHVL